jgi:2-(1,2-epoxy-1,2-dihydrophenyl)acetyl-CoA isomerase
VSDGVEFRARDGIARIRLDRPAQGNALDLAAAVALGAAAARAAKDPSVRCVVLIGTGRFFCTGGDVASFAAADRRGAFVKDLAEAIHRAVMTLATMAKPLLVAVNGPAAGAGFGLALLGDLVIASDAAHFTSAYSAIGLTPDGGLSWSLPRLAGLRRAQELIITNRRVGAAEAVDIGLVTRTVPAADFEGEIDRTAALLVAAPTAALGAIRALLAASATTSLALQLDAEAVSIGRAADSDEGREGVDAFLTKRSPSFNK